MVISQPGLTSNAILFEYTSTFGEKTLANTVILSIPLEKAFELRLRYSQFAMFVLRQIRLYAMKYRKLRMVCANMSVADQMRWFREIDPVSFSVINNKQLASLLGTTRETISRIKARGEKTEAFHDIPGKSGSSEKFG